MVLILFAVLLAGCSRVPSWKNSESSSSAVSGTVQGIGADEHPGKESTGSPAETVPSSEQTEAVLPEETGQTEDTTAEHTAESGESRESADGSSTEETLPESTDGTTEPGVTEEPTTEAQATGEPTAEVPTTEGPTTEVPTTGVPTSEEETKQPAEPLPAVSPDDLMILRDPELYSYEDMMSDTEILLRLFQGLVTADCLTQTADGRELLHFVIGSPEAETEIFINGAIHAREYLTAQLVMKQMVVYLQHIASGDMYGSLPYGDMWRHCRVHVVPMINPDGVSISQFGLEGIRSDELRAGIYQIASMDGVSVTGRYLERWKANAAGVDLNRNFDAYWEEYADPAGHPSSDHYKGTAPGSEPEAAALIALTDACSFRYTISYHAQGRVIYWRFENMEPILDRARSWVNQLAAATGYHPDGNYSRVDPAGYSDWAIYRRQIPSVVIEVGSGTCPYISGQFAQIWQENLTVWELTVERTLAEHGFR